MKPHKWAKEIIAWANGAEIEIYLDDEWTSIDTPQWHQDNKYRIKPQHKEPQYLYVYADEGGVNFSQWHTEFTNGVPYIGKIKLEKES